MVQVFFHFLYCAFFFLFFMIVSVIIPLVLTRSQHRRTQLRLAQRAYRCRKETKISTLENRIAELENTIKRMGGYHELPRSALSQ
jgi:hypothetical protein